jgi:membrane associated rhomboid family serine protease|tara:strand:+ start:1195 stop:1851 length:657 start_codon:yes stop_codon:yes gene_type:complete
MIESIPFVSLVIIGVNILVTVTGFKKETFFLKYHFQISKIHAGEYIRLLSSGFLHVSTTHILFNMVTFYFFVNFAVEALGDFAFIALYFGSLLCGNLFAYFFHYNEPHYSAVGASGAVTGVLFSALLLYPSIELMLFFIPIPIPGYLFGIGYMLYTLYGMQVQKDQIGHTAHFGGALGGIIITIALVPQVIYTSQLMLGILSITTLVAGGLIYKRQLP